MLSGDCILAGLFAGRNYCSKRRRFVPGLKPYQFAARGISRTFQNIRLFGELTVIENVRIGAYLRRSTNLFDALFRTMRLQREEAQEIENARDLLSRFNLTRFENELAKNLPYGDQRRLEIVRALATDPKLLLLDEPAAGMNPQEKAGLMALIRQIRDDFRLTILLIEHDMTLVMGICERIYVLDYGVIIAQGTPEEIRSNPKVIAAYLGEDEIEEPIVLRQTFRTPASTWEPGAGMMLTIRDLNVYYGGIHALNSVSLEVDEGEIVTMIGANGAGKSTTIRTVSGLVRARSGEILFEGKRIHTLPPHEIVVLGIGQSPEGRRVFSNMTVRENLELGAYTRRGETEQIKSDMERVFTQFPRLKERVAQSAGTLSGGEQQMLAIGRAVMARPRLLMLDEPSLGLAPFLVRSIFSIIREISKQGVTILLVEQNANQALKIANRGYVLETGRVILSDSAQNLLQNDSVRKAYLGE